MSERYTRLFSLPENLYAVGSPVIIAAGALLKDNQTGKVLAQLKLRNIQQKEIKTATISLIPMDTLGKPLGEAIYHQYLDLSVSRNQDFGQKIPVILPDAVTRSFEVTVEEVIFSDLTTWTSAGNTWESLQEPKFLSSLYDSDLVQQFRMEYGTDCVNQLLAEKDLWHCVCGALNKEEEVTCYKCGKSLASLQDIDMEALRQRKGERILREREEAEETAKRQAERNKILGKKALIAGVSIILLIAVAMMVRPAIIRVMDYKNAEELLIQGNYKEAIDAFEKLGDYRDASVKKDEATYQMNLLIYQNAMALFQAKKYEAAITAFRIIPDFDDSEQQIQNAQNAILEEKYVYAHSLLKEGNDQEAYETFVELGDYKDAQSMRDKFKEMCIRWEFYTNKKGVVREEKCSYDSQGRISAKEKDVKRNNFVIVQEFVYDSFDNVCEIKYRYEPKQSNSQAKPAANEVSVEKFYYDSNNHKTRAETTYLNGKTDVTLYQWYNENGECVCDGASGYLNKDERAAGYVYTIDAKGNIVQDTNGWIYWDGTFSPYSDWVTHTYTYDSKGNLTVNKYMSPSSYFGIYTNVTKYEYYGNGELLAYDGNWRYGYNKADGSRVWEYGGGYRCDVFMEMVYTPDA